MPTDMVQAALRLMEDAGPDRFSVRKLATTIGCDPMAILYHFKNKRGLERAMADALNAEIMPVKSEEHWRARLENLAGQYRELALKYPNTFPLLMQFWITGPADYRHAEMIYQAFHDAGLDEKKSVDLCFGWYASLIGLAAAEVCGMLKPASDDILKEIEQLPAEQFPRMKGLLPKFQKQSEGEAYWAAVKSILDGIEKNKSR